MINCKIFPCKSGDFCKMIIRLYRMKLMFVQHWKLRAIPQESMWVSDHIFYAQLKEKGKMFCIKMKVGKVLKPAIQFQQISFIFLCLGLLFRWWHPKGDLSCAHCVPVLDVVGGHGCIVAVISWPWRLASRAWPSGEAQSRRKKSWSNCPS